LALNLAKGTFLLEPLHLEWTSLHRCHESQATFGGLGTSFVENTIFILSGTGKDNVARFGPPIVRVGLVVWGLSLAGGVGVVLG
jgi:hypothetical protein